MELILPTKLKIKLLTMLFN